MILTNPSVSAEVRGRLLVAQLIRFLPVEDRILRPALYALAHALRLRRHVHHGVIVAAHRIGNDPGERLGRCAGERHRGRTENDSEFIHG